MSYFARISAIPPTGWLEPSDKQRQGFFAAQTQKQYQKAAKFAQKLLLTGSIAEVTKGNPEGAIALGLLHSIGALTWLDPFTYQRQGKINPQAWQQLQQTQQQIPRTMQRYLRSKTCRWQFLLKNFGFD